MTNATRYLTGFIIGFVLHTTGTYIEQGKDIFFPISIISLYLLIMIVDFYQNYKK